MSENSDKCIKWGMKRFHEWCQENSEDICLKTIPAEELNQFLCKFYLGVTAMDGKPLSVNSLTGIRYALQRVINTPPNNRNLHLINDPHFTEANKIFNMRKKSCANAVQRFRDPISKPDMKKLGYYFSIWYQNPTVLLDFVWFIVCLKYGSRSRDIWRSMKRSSFEICVSKEGNKFIYVAHPENCRMLRNDHYIDQRYIDYDFQSMPQNPAEIVEFYLKKSNSDCDAFFQSPRTFTGFEKDYSPWFKREAVGKNTLGNMMQSISKRAGLGVEYTPLCLDNTPHSVFVNGL